MEYNGTDHDDRVSFLTIHLSFSLCYATLTGSPFTHCLSIDPATLVKHAARSRAERESPGTNETKEERVRWRRSRNGAVCGSL